MMRRAGGRDPRCLILGNEMIVVFGSINIDLVARVAAIPRPGETVLADRYETLFGGKGANQAVAASRALGKADGVVMVGRVGRDGFGDSAIANLAKNGVVTDHLRRDDAPTGCAFISVDQHGENAITVVAGANGAVAAEDAETALIADMQVLVLQMEVPPAASLDVARHARSRGTRVLWNLAPASSTLDAVLCRDILATTDVLIVNEHEAVTFASALGLPRASHAVAASAIAGEGNCTCVVTAGAEGALAFHADGSRIAVPAHKFVPLDTTGAGDTFVGVLAAGLSEDLPFVEALKRACYAASLACLTVGAQPGMPDRSAIANSGA
jgi:ribokinase